MVGRHRVKAFEEEFDDVASFTDFGDTGNSAEADVNLAQPLPSETDEQGKCLTEFISCNSSGSCCTSEPFSFGRTSFISCNSSKLLYVRTVLISANIVHFLAGLQVKAGVFDVANVSGVHDVHHHQLNIVDSRVRDLTLVHTPLQYKKECEATGVSFTVGVLTFDKKMYQGPSPSPLTLKLKSFGVPWFNQRNS